jgi:hypothetical protein
MSANRETLQALMAASKKKDHEAFLALWVDEDLEYYWSMHAKPITSKEKLRKFLRNCRNLRPLDWTITHCVEQDDLMLCRASRPSTILRNRKPFAIRSCGHRIPWRQGREDARLLRRFRGRRAVRYASGRSVG